MHETADLRKAAWDATTTAILVVSDDGTICLVNDALERKLGYGRGELVGQKVEKLIPEAGRERLDKLRALDLMAVRADGSQIPVEIGLEAFATDVGPMSVVSMLDISERQQNTEAHAASLERQYKFERLISALSTEFIDVPDHELAVAITRGLEAVCQSMCLDRAVYHGLAEGSLPPSTVGWAGDGCDTRVAVLDDGDAHPWAVRRLLEGEPVSFERVEELPDAVDRESFTATNTRSALLLPLMIEGRVAGSMEFDSIRHQRTWTVDDIRVLTILAGVFNQVVARQRREAALQAASDEAGRLRDQLQVENKHLLVEARALSGTPRIVGQSAAIGRVLAQIDQVAATNATVLLLGETGTGKELFASYIHELSERHNRPMVRVNCAAIPATLMESELFGRERGAFTGSLARQIGRFELAHHSTIFLDEIGDLSPEIQVKLLRVLEERTIERLGSPHSIEVDVRIIAATHRNLEALMAEQVFRDDLFYRLNVFPIHVPPLRERVDDIPLLLSRFVEEFSRTFGKRIDDIDKGSIAGLQQYSWPGNIRELRNVVERAMIEATGRRLTIPSPRASAAALRRSPRLVDVEKEHIRAVLEGCGWRIRGTDGAASKLGLKPTTLETRMAKLGIKRPART